IVPGERIHIGPNNQIGVALPGIELMLLRGTHRAGHYLEHILGYAAMAVLHADRNSDDNGAAKLASCLRGHRSEESAIGEAAGADLNWFEQARERATRADGFDEGSLTEDDGVAGR